MQLFAIQRIVGLLLTLFSVTMVPPAMASFYFNDGEAAAFVIAAGLIFCAGLALWLPVARNRQELRLRDGFLVVVLFWGVLSLSASVPFLLLETPEISIVDSIFEATS